GSPPNAASSGVQAGHPCPPRPTRYVDPRRKASTYRTPSRNAQGVRCGRVPQRRTLVSCFPDTTSPGRWSPTTSRTSGARPRVGGSPASRGGIVPGSGRPSGRPPAASDRFIRAAPYARVMLVGRSGLSPVMVGRGPELDRLVGLIDARVDPSVALVAGEAGIGKTRLVQELVAQAPGGTVVLAGQADPGAESRPMELFRDALGSVVTSDGATSDGHTALLEA